MVNRDYQLRTRTIPASAPLLPPPPPLRPRTYTVTQHLKNQTLRHIQKSFPVRRTNGHNESRGLERQLGGVECYRLSALQCLLHLPRAQRWLLQHDVTEYDALGNFQGTQNPCTANPRDPVTGMPILAAPQDCMACAMKRLIDQYWGNHLLAADGTLGHLAANDSILREIYRVAITNPSFRPNPVRNAFGNFVLDARGNLISIDQQCDAEEFLTYLLAQCRGASIGNAVPNWNSTYEALFQFTFEERRYCSTCQTYVPPDPNPTIDPPTSYRQPSVGFSNMPIDRTNPGTVADAINNELADEASLIIRHCPSCNSGQLMTKRFHVDSAPEYMLAKFNPMYNAAPPPPPPPAPPAVPDMRKITNHNELPRIDEELDLTQCQVDTSTSLRYRLVAVIPHLGTNLGCGHWIATVRNNNGRPRWPRWYSMNDEDVYDIERDFILTNPETFHDEDRKAEEFQAVVLMYARIN